MALLDAQWLVQHDALDVMHDSYGACIHTVHSGCWEAARAHNHASCAMCRQRVFPQRSAERIAPRLQAELSVEHIEDAVQQDVGECILLLHFRGKRIENQSASALAPALQRCTSLHWVHLKYHQTSNQGASARTDRRFLL